MLLIKLAVMVSVALVVMNILKCRAEEIMPHEYLLPAAATIAGGLIGASSADKARKAAQAEAAADRQLQRNFAKQGIRWRVKDAQEAGIHPLYAMGASIPGYTPSPARLGGGDASMGNALASAGQDIGRAISATATGPERDLALRRAALQNSLLEVQILKLTRESQTGPSLPSATSPGGMPGQGNFPSGVDVFPRQISASSPANIGRQAGAPPGISYVMGSDGKLRIYPSTDAKELQEDNWMLEAKWAYQNLAKPMWTPNQMMANSPNTKEFPLPPGYYWEWSKWDQAYVKTKSHKPHRLGARGRNLYRPDRSQSGGGW